MNAILNVKKKEKKRNLLSINMFNTFMSGGKGVIMLQNRRFLSISTLISHNTKFSKFILIGTRRKYIYNYVNNVDRK